MQRYVAIIHQAESGGYGVSVPDFLGFISAGDSFDATLDNAVKGLRFHVEGMIGDGEEVPAPRELADLQADIEFEDDFAGAIVTLIPLLPPRSEPLRVNISMEAGLIAAIDAAAKTSGLTRSGFLAEAARRALAG